MISAIGSSDKKRHIVLATIGGVVWGAKEGYNTRIDVIQEKNSYKYILKTVFYNKEHNDAQDKYIKQHGNYFGNRFFHDKEKQINKEYYNKINQLIKNLKQDTRNNIKKIKKSALLKIPAKIIGGAAIGFGLSYLISFVKNKYFST